MKIVSVSNVPFNHTATTVSKRPTAITKVEILGYYDGWTCGVPAGAWGEDTGDD